MAKLIVESFRKTALKGSTVPGIRFLNTEGTFETKPYKLHHLDTAPASQLTLKRKDALLMYKQMNMIRRIEAASNALYKEQYIRGFCHLCTGQEAVYVGQEHALVPGDSVITSYRCHGWTYMRGVSPASILCELTGRHTGCSKGKGGSMHTYVREPRGFFGGNGIVGAQVPLGAGVAMAYKYKGQKNVNLALYGDGASRQGQIFEAMNMAHLWGVPCIFVCENNGWGMMTSTERSSASTEYYKQGDVTPGLWVDGMDLVTVMEGTRFLADLCREGKGPFVMEVATYRYVGHSMSEPGTGYRTRDEVKAVRTARDPISHFKEALIEKEMASEEELKAIEDEVKKEVNEGTRLAKSESELPLDELYADVYSNPLEDKIRGITPYTEHQHKKINTPMNLL